MAVSEELEGEKRGNEMFEQAVLESSYGNRRAFAAGAGFAGQAALAAFILIAPMIWPEVLPAPRLMMTVAAPPPAPAPPEHMTTVRPRTPQSAAPIFRADLLIPTRMPAQARQIVDSGPELAAVGIPGGIGIGGASANELLSSILSTEEPLHKPVVKQPEPKAIEEVKRIRVSSLDPARLIHLVEPAYPPIAKSAHIGGTVELRALIGTDGHVRELSVVSGHPLLRKAAMDAVRQWIYKPPTLGGESVEIIAPISVIFRLN